MVVLYFDKLQEPYPAPQSGFRALGFRLGLQGVGDAEFYASRRARSGHHADQLHIGKSIIALDGLISDFWALAWGPFNKGSLRVRFRV